MSARDKSLWAMAVENLSQSDRLPALDLHGLAAHVAVNELETFLNAQFMAGTEAVKVVCGIGTGKLLESVGQVLAEYKQHGLVEDFLQPKTRGVYIVRLSSKE